MRKEDSLPGGLLPNGTSQAQTMPKSTDLDEKYRTIDSIEFG
jgi:hypothetical protein